MVIKPQFERKNSNSIFSIDLLLTPPPDGTVELKAINNARHLFKSCSSLYRYETGDVFDVLNLIDKEFGGWPGWKNSAWGKKKFDLAELLLKFNQYNFQPIFDIETGIMNNYLDIKNYDQRVRFEMQRNLRTNDF